MGKNLKKSVFRSIHRTMHWLICIFISVLIYPGSAVAQQDTDIPSVELEEIIVIGERPLHSLRMEIYKTEDIKNKLFNSLNSTDEFDITCEWVAHTYLNSRIKRRECDVGFMKKARAEDARFFMDNVQYDLPFLLRSDHQLTGEFAHKTKAFNKEMVELAVKHPSLAKAMINEIELKQRYTVERRERFQDSILIGHTKPEDYFGDELKFLNFAYIAYLDGTMEEEIWNYWDRRLRSVIHQEPYRSIWLSSSNKNYTMKFIGYVTAILWDNTVGFSAE